MEIQMAVINSDMINDENHIYIPFKYGGVNTVSFGMAKFPCIVDRLSDSINDAVVELKKLGYYPSSVFVPFKRYHEEVAMDIDTYDTHIQRWLDYWGMKLFVMTPDYLKYKVKL